MCYLTKYAVEFKETEMACELCKDAGETLLWRNELCRVIRVDDEAYPGFCRVILNRHVKEMTDLDASERSQLMDVVFAVEAAVREVIQPDKINLASFGNVVPHLHWHVIPRFVDDKHFPNSIWGEAKRESWQRQVDWESLRRVINRLLG